MNPTYDDAIVGAGIVGLAHAFHLARRGRRVIVFERSPRACGASIRNFGMLWPIGQPGGRMHALALRSREFWLDVLRDSGLWHDPCGSLHLAYRDDEAQVLREFSASAGANGYDCKLLTPTQTRQKSSAVKSAGLLAALWSPSETCVDPRQVIAELPSWLSRRYGVRFEFGCPVTGYDQPVVKAGGRSWSATRLFVCGGEDLRTLYPEALADAGLLRCKLQMMRSQSFAPSWRLGPMLAAGLTLRHYQAFRECPTLESLRHRVARENPEFDRYGIHVMVSHNGLGELVIGDSHEYDEHIEVFDKSEIDRLILEYLRTFLDVAEVRIMARWHGIYLKHQREPYCVVQPAPGATIVTALGGAGMTLSFGLADMVVENALTG